MCVCRRSQGGIRPERRSVAQRGLTAVDFGVEVIAYGDERSKPKLYRQEIVPVLNDWEARDFSHGRFTREEMSTTTMSNGDNQANRGNGKYDALTALNAARQDKSIREAEQGRGTKEGDKLAYQTVLEWVQNKISDTEEYNRVLTKSLDSDEGTEQLRNIIYQLLQNYEPHLPQKVVERYKSRIFDDMTGLGILTQYIEDPDIEEINIYGPGPRQIEIVSGSKGILRLDEGFSDVDAVINIIKKMVRQGNMTIDASNPRVDSYMGGGVRISAMIPPIVRDDKGAVASIRKQTKSKITRDMLIESDTALAEEFELVELCTLNKVSGTIVGATGSGKTTMLNYLLTEYVRAEQDNARVYIIEESRELQLPEDALVFYTAVYGDEKSNVQVTAQDLLKSALRFHPTFITCAEMRGEEAMNAMSAAQTGHIVWSTIHCDNCEEAYPRLLTMCKMSGTDLSEELLLRNLINAFPIIVSINQLRDGSRKITGIYEATEVEGNRVIGHYIYKYQIREFERDPVTRKIIKIHGEQKRVGNLSDKLAQYIFNNCGDVNAVKKFANKDWLPEGFTKSDLLTAKQKQAQNEPPQENKELANAGMQNKRVNTQNEQPVTQQNCSGQPQYAPQQGRGQMPPQGPMQQQSPQQWGRQGMRGQQSSQPQYPPQQGRGQMPPQGPMQQQSPQQWGQQSMRGQQGGQPQYPPQQGRGQMPPQGPMQQQWGRQDMMGQQSGPSQYPPQQAYEEQGPSGWDR